MSTPTDPGISSLAQVTRVEMSYREAITAALDDAMAADAAVVLMGEDVAVDGGIFKTNHGLVEKYGPDRVRNTPICENGFMGVALGMSLVGLRPVVEIMFSDFLPTAGDVVVNQLPKYRYMSGGQFAVPVTVRSISGATGRFGTQHSATGESWFMHLPGLRVAAAATPDAAYSLLRAAILDNNPTLVHEHKGLYGRKGIVGRGGIADIGHVDVVRPGHDVTILASMLMLERATLAAERLSAEGISAEVIDLRWVRPLDLVGITRSVERTRRLVIVEEQVHAGGWGATVISELTMQGIPWSSRPRAISLPDDLPIPYSPPLEDAILPSVDRIIDAARLALA
jgi:pyruvate/2-oxoglutarate/acetoin dehydrogenase E1 component